LEALIYKTKDCELVLRALSSMWKLKTRKWQTAKTIRLLQLLLLLATLWFVFWAHVHEIVFWHKTFPESVQSSLLNVLLYSVSIVAIIYLEIRVRATRAFTLAPPSAGILEELEKENQLLKRALHKSKRTPSDKIGIGFLVSGALVLSASFLASSTVLAFIGLSLIFWGALFLFVKPVKFVRSSLLDFTAASSYATIDRITEDLNYKGRPIYIPPYPKEAYLPEYLKGLKEMIVYIPPHARAQDTTAMPTIEEMAKRQFLLQNPKGICIVPPGYGLINLFEKELKTEFTQIDVERLCSSLPTIIVDSLELAREFEINQENNIFHLKAIDSVYKALYSSEQSFKSIHSIGCPLTSAVACALAKTTGKLVTIVRDAVSPDLKTIEVWYQTLEA